MESLQRLAFYWNLWKRRREWIAVAQRHLFFVDNREQSLWGSISDPEIEILSELVHSVDGLDGPIVEVGTLFGLTTQLLVVEKPVEKQLITLDNFSWNPFALSPDDHRAFLQRSLRHAIARCHVKIFDGDSSEFYETYDGPVPSMIFIDAGHTYESVMIDIRWAVQAGIPLIVGHDYSPLHPGVVQAVDEVFGERVAVRESLWIHRTDEGSGPDIGSAANASTAVKSGLV